MNFTEKLQKIVEKYCINIEKGEIYSPFSGKRVMGTVTADGYRRIHFHFTTNVGTVLNIHVFEHVVIAYAAGIYEEGKEVDHKNNNRLDNRIANLQMLTRYENVYKSNTGRKGIKYKKRVG